MLLRRSLSSSSILTNAKKLKALEQRPQTDIQPPKQSTINRMDILQALPPPPLIDESELETHIISKVDRRKQLSGQRRVSFSSKSKCVYIEPRTPAEKNASFYSPEEYKRIYNENITTIKKMESKTKLPASETQQFRGLLATRARYEREQRIKFVVSKILREQRKSKTLCEDWVNDFSKKFSKQTAIAALYLAKIDARAAGARDMLRIWYKFPARVPACEHQSVGAPNTFSCNTYWNMCNAFTYSGIRMHQP